MQQAGRIRYGALSLLCKEGESGYGQELAEAVDLAAD